MSTSPCDVTVAPDVVFFEGFSRDWTSGSGLGLLAGAHPADPRAAELAIRFLQKEQRARLPAIAAATGASEQGLLTEEKIGYSPAAATLLALLCTEPPRRKVVYDGQPYWVAVGERGLPQGACTSPAISNQVARKLDRRLAGLCANPHSEAHVRGKIAYLCMVDPERARPLARAFLELPR